MWAVCKQCGYERDVPTKLADINCISCEQNLAYHNNNQEDLTMNKERLDYLKASQKRIAIHGKTGRYYLVEELLTEINALNVLLEGHKDVVSEYAQTILVLRNKLEIVESSLASATKRLTELEEDLPMIGESKYAKRTRR